MEEDELTETAISRPFPRARRIHRKNRLFASVGCFANFFICSQLLCDVTHS